MSADFPAPAGLIQVRPPSIWMAGSGSPPSPEDWARSTKVSVAPESKRTTPPSVRSSDTAEDPGASTTQPASTFSPFSSGRGCSSPTWTMTSPAVEPTVPKT
jgi:hypothetical protein